MSPDGKTIAYVGYTQNGDSYRVADLWTMSADGSNAALRSAGFDRDPQDLAWSADSGTMSSGPLFRTELAAVETGCDVRPPAIAGSIVA